MSLFEPPPTLNEQDVVQLAHELYGLEVTVQALPSERDQNFILNNSEDGKYILKVANALEDRATLEAQNGMMQWLVNREVTVCPQVYPTLHGQLIAETVFGGKTYFVRLVSFLEGTVMGEVKTHSADLLYHLGQTMGQIDQALLGFDHAALHYDFHWDLARALPVMNEHIEKVKDLDMRMLIEQVVANFKETVEPLLPTLRQSVIHNDANDYNLIIAQSDQLYEHHQTVSGVIDFGDVVYTHTINELAITIAYAILDKSDPLASAAQIVCGYHTQNPLTNDELAILWHLVQLRLCVSICLAAHQQMLRPDDAYLGISQQPIRNTLPKLVNIHARLAEAVFRDACGLSPSLKNDRIKAWLTANRAHFAPVLQVDMRDEPCIVLDLSIGSPLIHGDFSKNEEPFLTPRIWAEMAEAGVKVSVGRYDEPRLIYSSSIFKTGEGPLDPRRTIHIGFDLFAPAGTPVHAPLDGIVHVANYNPAPLDYGGLVVLQHETPEGDEFYTLYGHLSEATVEGVQVGQKIAKGEPFATFGAPHENGGWPPHLHLQVITDLLNYGADFPGVGLASQRSVWKSLSPDPNLLVNVPSKYFPASEPSPQETLRIRKQKIGPSLSIGYRKHLKIVRGWQQYLFDETGQKYLDAYNNVPHVGHAHPRVVAAAERQMRVLNTNTRYLHDNLNHYAERLTTTMPNPLNVCFFLNSASEANELALRLARTYTGQRDLIVLEGAYHGHTTTLIDISPYKHDGPGGNGAPNWVHTAPVADVYRGAYKADDAQAAEKYAVHVKSIINQLQSEGKGICGYIAESCPSVGGQIIFPEGYLAAAYRHVRAAGGICIADEVQTGYGRIGSHMYAFEQQEVIPDIVILGKPIGNGHPIAAVVTTTEIADAFNNGMEFFSTFGGNTVSCAVGIAVLDVLQQENLMAQAHKVGQHMLNRLQSFKERYEIVGDVRGAGLFLGIELVRNRQTLEPAAAEASFISNQMREHHILMGTDGPYHNVVKIRPPMPFNYDDADLLVDTMDKILAANFA